MIRQLEVLSWRSVVDGRRGEREQEQFGDDEGAQVGCDGLGEWLRGRACCFCNPATLGRVHYPGGQVMIHWGGAVLEWGEWGAVLVSYQCLCLE